MNNPIKNFILELAYLTRRIIPNDFLYLITDKFIYQKEIRNRNLIKDHSPLFSYILFELRSKCNGDCSFCSANRRFDKRKDIVMPIELFKKAINELKQINFSGVIAFYLNNEPLIVPNFFDYVKIAVDELSHVKTFHICTNGLALTEEKGKKLLKSGINLININVYDDDTNSPLPPNILKFENMTTKHNNENNKKVTLLISRRKKNQFLLNRAGTSPNRNNQDSVFYKGYCSYPFDQLCLGPTGDVSMCCNDVFFSNTMGNIRNKKIVDIWNGKEFTLIRNHLLQGNRFDLTNCRKCDYFGVRYDKNDKNRSYLYKILHVMTKGRALFKKQ